MRPPIPVLYKHKLKSNGQKEALIYRFLLNLAIPKKVNFDTAWSYGYRTNYPQKIIKISRAKGLGELDAEQLETAAFNKETRRLVKVRIEDAIHADKMTSLLMGNVVDGRKKLIIEEAENYQYSN